MTGRHEFEVAVCPFEEARRQAEQELPWRAQRRVEGFRVHAVTWGNGLGLAAALMRPETSVTRSPIFL